MEYIVYGVGFVMLAVGLHAGTHFLANRRNQDEMNALGDRLHEIR
jgi:hypothetical protein